MTGCWMPAGPRPSNVLAPQPPNLLLPSLPGPMFTTRLRLAAGLAALALIFVACYVLVHAKRPIAAALFAPATILAFPLFASNRPPRQDEWASLNENVTRFRTAG